MDVGTGLVPARIIASDDESFCWRKIRATTKVAPIFPYTKAIRAKRGSFNR